MRDKPLSPPSILMKNDKPISIGILQGLRILMTNRNYVLLYFTYLLLNGSGSAMNSMTSSLTSKYDYSVQDNSLICMVYLVAGIVNAFVLGAILDRW